MTNIALSQNQQQIAGTYLDRRVFVHGQAGSGKTTAAVKRMLALIKAGVPADSILVLIPQRSLAAPYKEVIQNPKFHPGGEPSILTIGGLAQRMLSLFWPLMAKQAGFAKPSRPPRFLTLETAQYYLAGMVEPLLQKGYFESITIDPNRLYSQIIDNLNKSAVVGFDPTEIADRLIQAWTGKPTQSLIYQQAQECALLFREFCLQHNLLDFSLQLSIFAKHLWPSLLCRQHLSANFKHLIYDNAEEDYPVAHDIVASWLPDFDSALIISDDDGGFRTFMGADPRSALGLSTHCDEILELGQSFIKTPPMEQLEKALEISLKQHRVEGHLPPDLMKAFSIQSFRFYPQLMDWVTSQSFDLIHNKGYLPSEIVILTPFLSDSLRFSFQARFAETGMSLATFRPSRGLRDEPGVKAVLTLVKLAFPDLGLKPSKDEVRNAILLSLGECDYIRADLIAQILYSPSNASLRSFELVKPEMQQRLTYLIGERFEQLRKWLIENNQGGNMQLDFFISRLFGEVLSQPGFGFHQNFDAAAAISRLVESAQKFRQVMSEELQALDLSVKTEYIHLVEEGILSAQYLSDRELLTNSKSILITPAFSYLMSNRPARAQFWLDIGSQGWWTRLDQPLTHPYVLNRNWKSGDFWTDAHENTVNQTSLYRVAAGLIRRCSGHIYMCALGINEQGNEERGALMMSVQTLLRKMNTVPGGDNG